MHTFLNRLSKHWWELLNWIISHADILKTHWQQDDVRKDLGGCGSLEQVCAEQLPLEV